jgi:hypothetical protein
VIDRVPLANHVLPRASAAKALDGMLEQLRLLAAATKAQQEQQDIIWKMIDLMYHSLANATEAAAREES